MCRYPISIALKTRSEAVSLGSFQQPNPTLGIVELLFAVEFGMFKLRKLVAILIDF